MNTSVAAPSSFLRITRDFDEGAATEGRPYGSLDVT